MGKSSWNHHGRCPVNHHGKIIMEKLSWKNNLSVMNIDDLVNSCHNCHKCHDCHNNQYL